MLALSPKNLFLNVLENSQVQILDILHFSKTFHSMLKQCIDSCHPSMYTFSITTLLALVLCYLFQDVALLQHRIRSRTTSNNSIPINYPSGLVFLSFNAEELGKNFGAHLHRALLRADIQTITGDADTLTSVQQSRIAVVVFSKNYVSSGTALDELIIIWDCTVRSGFQVIPVFYNVDKYSLIHQLETSEGGNELQHTSSVSRRRQALEKIAGLPGLDLNHFADRDESACINKFVEMVLSELDIINSIMDTTSSSPSMPSNLDLKDIFISFCGADTRYGFASHLNMAFARAGISTFKDDNILIGDCISEAIERAIERAKIGVVVFSKHFAHSKWTLNELVWITKHRRTGLLLVPAFYDVDPLVVRRQTKKYAEAFQRHDQLMSSEVQTWRYALTEAADISGFAINCDNINGNEAKFIKKITEVVAGKVRSFRPELTDATDEPASSFQHSNQNGNRVEIVKKIIEKVHKAKPIYSTEMSSLASSSSSLTQQWNVFLSFRGVDTRKKFISHLYMEMKHARIRVFLDDDALRIGRTIKSGLLAAIRESKVLITVFSKNFTSSRWCLDELVEMLERQDTQKFENQNTTRQLFFPIFFDVDPQDVEKQEGSFGKAFESNNKRYSKEMVDIWRAALSKAGTMEGWDLHNSWDSREADLIQDVIAKVLLVINH